jgi:y4mF family transcriptional regulator
MTPSPSDIGLLIRQTRKQQGLTQVELASYADVSVRFIHELEHGKASAELGLCLKVLATLGIDVRLLPPAVDEQ